MYDVVVVGAGIGGLTVAALLSARGLKTCVLERQSQVGGCIARVEFGGYDFEPGMGLYTSFGPGEIYEQLFSQLPVEAPATSLITSAYVKRNAGGTDMKIDAGALYSIDGGPATLAERLAQSIKMSGGTVRLDSPVLRLAFTEAGEANGVDLLSGERMEARTIVSNLTIWDTYGKLFGLNRTPAEIKKQLSARRGNGVYAIYASITDAAISRLPAPLMRVEDAEGEFTLAISSRATAPPRKRGVTFTCPTEIESWFAYQSSEEDYDEWDQGAMTQFWQRLHAALPELGGDVEIIETANPRTYYDQTRRKLGMVLGVDQTGSVETYLGNVLIVGDTVSEFSTLESVIETAMTIASDIANRG